MYFLYIEIRLSLKVAYLADITTHLMANPYQRKATSVKVITLSLHTKYPTAPIAYAIQRNNCTYNPLAFPQNYMFLINTNPGFIPNINNMKGPRMMKKD